MSLINQMLQDLEQRKAEVPAALSHSALPMFPAGKNKHAWYVSPQLILAVSVAVMAMATMKIVQKQSVQGAVVASSSVATAPVLSEAQASVFKPLQARTVNSLGIDTPVSALAKVSFQPMLDKTLTFSLSEGRLSVAPRIQNAVHNAPSTVLNAAARAPMLATKVAYMPSVQMDTTPVSLPASALVANAPELVAAPAKRNSEKTMFAKHVSPEQEALNDYNQAIALIQQGRVTEAQEKLKTSLQTYPANQEVRQVLVGLLIEDKRKSEAIALLKEGLQLSPDQPQITLTLARLQLDMGQQAEAIASLERGLSYAQHDAQYQAFLAMLLQRAERHQGAINHFQNAIKISGEKPAWLVGLAASLQAEGRAQEAYTVFAQARAMALDAESRSFVEARLKQLAPSQSN